MNRWRRFCRAAALVGFAMGTSVAAEERAVIEFGGAVFDVTGAGSLLLGDIDAVLEPFRRDFRAGMVAIELDLIIDGAGTVIACRNDGAPSLAAAGQVLCAQALTEGRFTPFPWLVLDYTQATYRLSIRSTRDKPAKGLPRFWVQTAYPYHGAAIRFGDYSIPPVDDRLMLADLATVPMDYPRDALQTAIEANVVVALMFGADGKVANCRPVYSSNTSRIAYETCRAARRAYRLLSPPDARPYVWRTVWKIAQ